MYPAPAGAKTKADPAAFVSELTARTELDGSSLESLALGLAGGGVAARARLALLEAEGKRGLAAVIGAYARLDGPGRDLARRIIDAAPCKDKLGLYIPHLTGKDREEADRARDRIRRCGKDAGPPLLAALEAAKGDARIAVAEEAAFVAPDAAVPFLVLALDAAKTPDERRPFRRAIGKAATRDVGVRALGRALADPMFGQLSLAARVDFLRALGDEAPRVEGSAAALAAASKAATAFRERYLLLSPASSLAKSGDKGALTVLGSALSDKAEHRLRARGAELAAGIAPLRPKLLVLIDDPEVRVREAALGALASKGALDGAATIKLLVRLVKDPWTFVRRAAAAALVSAPTSAETDKSIGAAVDFEPSPIVRAEMMSTLGARRAKVAAPVVAERAFDQRETADVRSRALEALGDMCATEHLEAITELALRGQAPVFEADRKLAIAGITALGRLRPADLKTRLAPLSAKSAPAEIREVTRLVLADPARPCPASATK